MLGSLIISRDLWQENIILQSSNMFLLLIEIEISNQSGFGECNNSFCRLLYAPQPGIKEGRTRGRKMG